MVWIGVRTLLLFGLMEIDYISVTGTVIGRVWSNRATREAFVLVWNGIFKAIQTITAKVSTSRFFQSRPLFLGRLGIPRVLKHKLLVM
jgi:hypothetical protein